MARISPLLLAIPLLVAFGAGEGLWTNRWCTSDAGKRAAEALARVPLTVGDWEGEELQMEPEVVAKAELTGYRMRRYVHRPSGATLRVLLVCGAPGPITAHSPDVCYDGTGYHQQAAQVRRRVEADAPAGPADFWLADFEKTNAADPDRVRVFWSYTATGPWTAPDSPRLAFAAHQALYKLYVIRHTLGANEPVEKDPALDFLRVFLPQMRGSLFPGT